MKNKSRISNFSGYTSELAKDRNLNKGSDKQIDMESALWLEFLIRRFYEAWQK